MELVSALKNISHHLRELDLCANDLQDSGLHKLLDGMENTERKLQVLRKVFMIFSISMMQMIYKRLFEMFPAG